MLIVVFAAIFEEGEGGDLSQWRSHWGGLGGRVLPLTAKKMQKIGETREKIWKKEEKSGRKGKNREGSFTLPLLTDRAGCATDLSGSTPPAIDPPKWMNQHPDICLKIALIHAPNDKAAIKISARHPTPMKNGNDQTCYLIVKYGSINFLQLF